MALDLDEPRSQPPEAHTYQLELDREEMLFLRLILTNASIGPARLKQICGDLQAKVEERIGPLPDSR